MSNTTAFNQLCMAVIAETADAVYLRLPEELQEPIVCHCDHCKKEPKLAKWDTLVVPKHDANAYSWRVHMPPPGVAAFKEHMRKKEAAKTGRNHPCINGGRDYRFGN